MRSIKIIAGLLLAFALTTTTALAQKQSQKQPPQKTPKQIQRQLYKDLRAAIKVSNIGGGEKIIAQCVADSLLRENPETYQLAVQLQMKKYDLQNTNHYLKRAYDTVALFQSTYDIFNNCLTLDQKESIPDAKGRVKAKSRSKSRGIMKRYYPNIFSGGMFHVQKKNYAVAEKFFSIYIDAAQSPIFESQDLVLTDPKMKRAAFWAMTCSFEQQKFNDVFKYDDIASLDSVNLEYILKYKAVCHEVLGNKAGMEAALREGLIYLPNKGYFFSHLVDYYNEEHRYDDALTLCDSMIQVDPGKTVYTFGKCSVLFNLKSYDKCRELSQQTLKRDTTLTELNYYIASCYYNQANSLNDRISVDLPGEQYTAAKEQVNQLYRNALPPMEAYRKLHPDKQDRWGAPLYQIYLTLNMADKFTEIEKLLEATPAPDAKADAKGKK